MENQQSLTIVKIVVSTMAVVAIAGMFLVGFLLWDGVEIEKIAIVTPMPTSALTGLAAILASTRTNPSPQVVADQLAQLAEAQQPAGNLPTGP